MSSNGTLLAVCGLTLATTVFVAASGTGGSDGRFDDLEKRIEAAETANAEQTEDLAKEIRKLRAEMAARGDAEASGRAARRAVEAVDAIAAATGGGDGEGMTRDGRPIEEIIAERLEAKIDEKMETLAKRGRNRSMGGEWKPTIAELDEELELTEAQQAEVKAIFDSAHDEIYVLMKTMRLDGGSLLDDLVVDLKEGVDPAAAMKDVFTRLFSEKVPGTDRTYIADLIMLRGDVEEQLGRHLSEDQTAKLATLNVDLLGVKTGHDPVGEYVQAMVQ